MHGRAGLSLFGTALLMWAAPAWSVDSYVTEPAPAQAFAAIPPTIAQFLNPHGVRLVSNIARKKTEICDVWWRKQIPTQTPSGGLPDRVYRGLTTGQFLGVVSYLVPREDFQHHVLKPGL